MAVLALRVFPGVLVSMLLAGPVFATQTLDNAPPTTKGQPLEHRRQAAPGRTQKAAARSAHKQAQSTTRRRPQPAAHATAFLDDSPGYDGAAASYRTGWSQTGLASWYGGSRWQGRRTSSGSRYDQDAMTAAHATLPLGTRVHVALPNHDAAVTVTITDRPGTDKRIIDLSRGAARALGILDKGVAMVTLTQD